jgi:hypothetical protein
MKTSANRRALQVAIALLALVPLGFGIRGVIVGASVLDAAAPAAAVVALDNQLRFLSAIWFAVGVVLLVILPRIEQHAFVIRFVGGAVFLGGVGRLISVLVVGSPVARLWGSMLVELLLVPLLVLWQARVARAHASSR